MAEAAEQMLRGATDALNAGDVERFLSFHTDDAVVHVPGRSPVAGDHGGRDALRRLFQAQIAGGAQNNIHAVLVSGEHAVLLVELTGSAGGQQFRDQQVVVCHVREDKISEAWVYSWDQYGFDEAISALPSGQQD